MNFAVVTPWPPAFTGIADYSYDLVCGMIRYGCHVTVCTEEKEPKPLSGVSFCSPKNFNGLDFDKIIYQMGNNSNFHTYMIPLMYRYPGTIHLHDLVLHHIMAYILYVKGDNESYFKLINKWYGVYAKELFKDLIGKHIISPWDTALVNDFPLFEEILLNSNSCIVHSEYAKTKVFPELKCVKLPQLYLNELQDLNDIDLNVNTNDFNIGIFGGVDFNKRAKEIIKVVEMLIFEKIDFKIHIVGKISEECSFIYELAENSLYKDNIVIHGRVEHNIFLNLLRRMNLCLALRFPTMGETSAIVMRALQFGVPVVVSDVGWYSELPSFIPKIKPEKANEIGDLYKVLKYLISNEKSYLALRQLIEEYSFSELNYESMIHNYLELQSN
jgi:glycosyltransferase involved in cell wall biosynthesis